MDADLMEEEKDDLTRVALAQVDAGLTIPHEEVVAWFESLSSDHPLPMPTVKNNKESM
jgi:predicted transcriptional regulator